MARNPKARNNKSQRHRPKPSPGGGRPRRGRPKVCIFCSEHTTWVDYKDVVLLRRFINDRGRIKARGATGTCMQHQRDVAVAVKTAREVALLPYVVRTVSTEARRGLGGDRRGNGTDAPAGGRPSPEMSGTLPEAAESGAVDKEVSAR